MNEIPVLYEDDFCIVLNKPPGLPVQGGEGIKNSLDSLLAEKYSSRPFLIHRLDRDTSGIILVAKTKEAAAAFSALFAGKRSEEKRLLKKYLAVSAGIPDPQEGIINLVLETRGRRLVSKTSYRLVRSAASGGVPCSLLELELGSGRMHQIRRHLSAIGHPVLGDDKYGDFSLNRRLKKTAGLKRLLLHSHRLFIKPFPPYLPSGLRLEAPLPDHFTDFRLDNGLSFFP